MNLNRDELLLLARTGRGPHSTRAGPGPDERFEAGLTSRRLRRRARSGLTLRAGVRAGKGLRHVLGPRTDGSARLPRTLQHVDEEYFELEFVVGFPAEEDMLR